jgi:uncharacterized protein (TIGR03083 family)
MVAFDSKTQLANVAVVADETARMKKAFRAWPETYWQRPTYCPDWRAADAVAHLVTGGDFYAQAVVSGREGDPKMPWGVSDMAGFRAARAAAVKELIDGGPEALIEGFEESAAKFQEALESLREEDLAKAARHPIGLFPIGLWVGMRLNELIIHDWDIRQPHEANAALSPTGLPAMLTVLPEMQKRFLERRPTDGLEGVHVFRAGETSWAFSVQGTSATYQAQPPETFDTCLSADAESLILLSMGRSDAEAKRQSGALTLTGDTQKAQRLCETLFQAF